MKTQQDIDNILEHSLTLSPQEALDLIKGTKAEGKEVQRMLVYSKFWDTFSRHAISLVQ